MRRIKNTKELDDKVRLFCSGLFKRKGVHSPITLLRRILTDPARSITYGITQDKIDRYINAIIQDHASLLIANSATIPKLIKKYNRIILQSEMQSAFSEAVIKAMRYDYLRSKEFPEFLREFNIQTCVYCHSQSTLVVENLSTVVGAPKWKALLQLDHKYAKSKYPFLCTSFYNLYPICANCNLSKGVKESSFVFYSDTDELDILTFGLDSKSILKYWKTKKHTDIVITIKPKHVTARFVNAYKKMFNIAQIYTLQKDIAEELLHKVQVYNHPYNDTLVTSFKKLFPDVSLINRLLIGNYDKPEEMLKRPMSKFIQEIARDIKLIP